jgi:hypothetical protein
MTWNRESDRLFLWSHLFLSFPDTKHRFRSLNQNSQGQGKNPHSFAVPAHQFAQTSKMVKPAGNSHENRAFGQ